MMLATLPFFSRNLGSRKSLIEYAWLARWLCRRPIVCPTSWATTYRINSACRSSGNGNLRARSSTAEHWTKYHMWTIFKMSCQKMTCDEIVSPDRGSPTCGPIAFCVGSATQRMTLYRESSASQFGSSARVGGSLAMMAFLNPAFSNAGCQSSTPFFMAARNFSGTSGAM